MEVSRGKRFSLVMDNSKVGSFDNPWLSDRCHRWGKSGESGKSPGSRGRGESAREIIGKLEKIIAKPDTYLVKHKT